MKEKNNKKGSIIKKAVMLLIVGGLLLSVFGVSFRMIKVLRRNHGEVSVSTSTFTESHKFLQNPYRGFYLIYGFVITDKAEDYEALVAQKMCKDTQNTLAMIQVNLREYREGVISAEGLQNIRQLFQALKQQDKQYIVRFLYDWSGNGEEMEPENADTILGHMRQLEDIFGEYEDIIFIHQGLFIGNWGEMNGTRHLGQMQTLALQLMQVTGEKTFLGVRMPAQWRQITQIGEISSKAMAQSEIASRLSLFNDGMLGNAGDYGTYGTESKADRGLFTYWNREEELVFQDELCKYVPNGGEVIADNPYNDFENAKRDMATMHITYINRDYDQEVLDKWAETTVFEEGCFNGVDGLTYMERHLGYRLLIEDTAMEYDKKADTIHLIVNLKNVGFAPLYRKPEVYLVIANAEKSIIRNFQIAADVRTLTGGRETDKILPIQADISLEGYEAGEYEVYFCLKDVSSGQKILLANEQENTLFGYEVGRLLVEPIINPLTGKEWNTDNFLK